MEIKDVVEQARESLTVDRVYGKPIEKGGLTIVPVAAVRGGGGGGSGSEEGGSRTGSGGGFGVVARPVGVYVISDTGVEWREATDNVRVMLGWQIVALAWVFMLKTIVKQRGKTKRRKA